MILPALLIAMGVAAVPGASSACEPVRGWKRAVEQKPSPVPYSEPVRNVAVQLSRGEWSWNDRKISEADLFRYLRRTRAMNPVPLNLFAFLPRLGCSEKRTLQAKITDASACPIGGKPCLEGTDSEYRAARGLP